jgi:uncharacterized membrane protein YkvA (DUF1232 family)
MKLIPNILSPNYWRRTVQEVQLVWNLLKDPRVPLYLKAFPAIVLIYLISPFDLIPGFLPIVGQLDDTGLMLVSLNLFTRLAPKPIVAEYKAQYNLL